MEDVENKEIEQIEKCEEEREEATATLQQHGRGEKDPREELTQDEVASYSKVYEQLTDSRNHKMSTSQLGTALRMLGLNPRLSQLADLIHKCDPTSQGWLDFRTFLLPVCWTRHWMPDTTEDVVASFQVLDKQGRGVIAIEELVNVVTTMGEELQDLEVETFIKMADKNNDGFVDYEQLVATFKEPLKEKKKAKRKSKNKGRK